MDKPKTSPGPSFFPTIVDENGNTKRTGATGLRSLKPEDREKIINGTVGAPKQIKR